MTHLEDYYNTVATLVMIPEAIADFLEGLSSVDTGQPNRSPRGVFTRVEIRSFFDSELLSCRSSRNLS
jgi:hypothetical protein